MPRELIVTEAPLIRKALRNASALQVGMNLVGRGELKDSGPHPAILTIGVSARCFLVSYSFRPILKRFVTDCREWLPLFLAVDVQQTLEKRLRLWL